MYDELMHELRQVINAVKDKTTDIDELKRVVTSISDRLQRGDEWQKAVNERLNNIEEALSKPVEQKLKTLPVYVNGETPQERIRTFLSLVSDEPVVKQMQDLIDTYTVYALVKRHKHQWDTSEWERSHLCQRFFEVTKQITGVHLPGYIPEALSARVTQLIRIEPSIARLLGRIDMPAPTYRVPLQLAGITIYLTAPGVAIPLSTPTAPGPVTFDAKKLAGGVQIVEEVTEDSLPPVIPLLQTELAFAFASGIDDVIINGDVATPHMDADVTGTNDRRKAWNGLRKLAPAASKVDFGNDMANALTKLRTVRAKMGKYGIVPARLAWVVSPAGYMRFLSIPEVVTVDKYGPQATVVTGELGKLDGIPIIVSPQVREDLNAAGVFDNVTKNRTIVLLVHLAAFAVGERRAIEIDTDRDVRTQVDLLVASWRGDFKGWYPGETAVGIAYNFPI